MPVFEIKSKWWCCLWLVLLFPAACSQTEEDDYPEPQILLSATPASVTVGGSVIAAVTASASFFKEELAQPLVSSGGLTLTAVDVQDSRNALLTFVSSAETEVGLHRFELFREEEIGVVEMAVTDPSPTPGTITVSGNAATAGAKMVQLDIHGEGETHFDSACKVKIEGADGVTVRHLNVKTERWIELFYDVAEDQPAAQAALILLDGTQRYEASLTVLSAPEYDNLAPTPVLTKGRQGWIALSNPNANLHAGTQLMVDNPGIEVGRTIVVNPTAVKIPLRVPFDFAGRSLALTAITTNQGGAMVEKMFVEVELAEPGYLVTSPPLLQKTTDEQSVELISQGFDLADTEQIVLENTKNVVLADWQMISPSKGRLTFVMNADAPETVYRFVVDNGTSRMMSAVVVDGFGKSAHPAADPIPRGDHLLLPMIVKGVALDGSETLLGNDAVQVLGLAKIENHLAVAEIKTHPMARVGRHTLQLNTSQGPLDLQLTITRGDIRTGFAKETNDAMDE